VAAIAIGNFMPVKAAGKTEEETEKRLVAAMRTGRPLISIDNVSDELGGDLLCQLIERPESDVRVLGTSDQETIRNRAFTTFCNGNSLVIRADACRRVILASLDAKVEQPENRKFTGNPVDTVLADRGAYIAAALTVCRAYFVAERPGRADRLGSYEGWSDTVRSALMGQGSERSGCGRSGQMGATAQKPHRERPVHDPRGESQRRVAVVGAGAGREGRAAVGGAEGE
jgi:hypothetical protein